MHLLILTGIALLSISSIISLYGMVQYYKNYKKIFSNIFLFNFVAIVWNLVSIFYRFNSDLIFVKPVVLIVGILLPLISWLWFDISLRQYSLYNRWIGWIKISISIIFIVLEVNNFFSPIAVDIQIIDTGLIRYKLSFEGSILFSFSFLVLFFGNIFQFLNFKNQSSWMRLSNLFVFLSLAGVIFPWKEFGLNVVLVSLAGFALSKSMEEA